MDLRSREGSNRETRDDMEEEEEEEEEDSEIGK